MAPKRKATKAATEDLSKLTVAQLKKKCKEAGLDCLGKKQELILRLGGDEGPPAKLSKESTIQKAMKAMTAEAKKEAKASARNKTFKVDEHFGGSSAAKVHKDYACMLNQTNIGRNNNKFYVIQVVEDPPGNFVAFNRWGRVGEVGNSQKRGYRSADDAIKDFQKKFSDKTKNKWEDREKFKVHPRKYTLLEMSQEEDDGDSATTRLPLGKLSKTQIVKGFGVLDDIAKVIRKQETGNLTQLSSQFYTLIPHSYSRSQVPPVIKTEEMLRSKLDMLLTLGDIEIAQNMMKESKAMEAKAKTEAVEPPVDTNYKLLGCTLSLLQKNEKEYKMLESFLEATNNNSWRKLKLIHIWKMDRGDSEAKRFRAHDALSNRKLLWHGTNVAVVAAILKSGLRIMPHAGGRVGRGLYFASENSKSACYVGTAGKTGIMFLNEVALGKEKHIKQGDGSLTAAPKGFDSIVARGNTEPDPKMDQTLVLDGKKVVVPVGKPVQQKQFKDSHFSQSEYLVYKESQVRMRYVLQIQFG